MGAGLWESELYWKFVEGESESCLKRCFLGGGRKGGDSRMIEIQKNREDIQLQDTVSPS